MRGISSSEHSTSIISIGWQGLNMVSWLPGPSSYLASSTVLDYKNCPHEENYFFYPVYVMHVYDACPDIDLPFIRRQTEFRENRIWTRWRDELGRPEEPGAFKKQAGI